MRSVPNVEARTAPPRSPGGQRGAPGARVGVDADPVDGARERAAAQAAQGREEGRLGRAGLRGPVEADAQVVDPAASGLVVGGEHAAHERLADPRVRAVGGVGRAGDVGLVRDLQVGHVPVRPELADAGADEVGEAGDVTRRRGGPVAQDELDLEAVGRVRPDLLGQPRRERLRVGGSA